MPRDGSTYKSLEIAPFLLQEPLRPIYSSRHFLWRTIPSSTVSYSSLAYLHGSLGSLKSLSLDTISLPHHQSMQSPWSCQRPPLSDISPVSCKSPQATKGLFLRVQPLSSSGESPLSLSLHLPPSLSSSLALSLSPDVFDTSWFSIYSTGQYQIVLVISQHARRYRFFQPWVWVWKKKV